MISNFPDTPKWMTAVIIVLLLPVFQFPYLVASAPDVSTVKTLVWIYPFYCLVAAWLAWQCFPQRPALSWILLALMVMSHVSVWCLVAMTPSGLDVIV